MSAGMLTEVELVLAPTRISTVNVLPAHSLLSLYVKDIAMPRPRPGHRFASWLLYVDRSRIVTSTLRPSSTFVLLISVRRRHAAAVFASSLSSAATAEPTCTVAPSMATSSSDRLGDRGFMSHLS